MTARPLPGLIRNDVGSKDWVNFAKGVAIILVVLYHCMLFLHSVDFQTAGLGRIRTALEMFPMPIFFAIAGMYHFRVVTWTLAQTWKRRLWGYLYLYVLWSVIRFAFYLIAPNVRSDGAGASATDPIALLTVLVWPVSSYWFILALFVFTAILWLVRDLPPWLPIAASAVLSVAIGTGFASTSNVGWDRMSEYFVFFLAGALLSQRIFAAVPRAPRWVLPASLVVFGGTAAVASFVPLGSRIPGLVLLGETAAVVFGILVSAVLVRVRPLSWVSYLGVRSLHIYLVHVFVIALLAFVVQSFPGVIRSLPAKEWIVLYGMLALTLVISALLGRVLSRFSWLYVPPTRRRKAGARRAAAPAAVPSPTTVVPPGTSTTSA